jgi:hypothetical protein
MNSKYDMIKLHNSNFIADYSKNLFWDYILIFLLIATSGIVFFYYNQEYIFLSLIIAIIIYFQRNRIEKLDRKFLIILLLFIFWEIIQNYYFQLFSIKQIIGTFARFLMAYLTVKTVGRNFVKVYVNIIYFFTLVSFIFYILYFFPNITNLLVNSAIKEPLFPRENLNYEFTPNYILFSFDGYKDYRNAGPFWEAGAFSVFLIIAMILNTILHNNNLFNKKNLIFVFAIITTLSTAGYITLFFIIISFLLIFNPSLKKILILIPIILLFIILIINLSFLLEKIENNVVIAENDNTSRFGSALSDYKLISKNPLLGYGRNLESRYNTSVWNIKEHHRNNGITAFITQWGIVLFIFYFYNYFKSISIICKYYNVDDKVSSVFLIAILLLGFSQGLFQYPFFHSLMFLQFAYSDLNPNELSSKLTLINSKLFQSKVKRKTI